MERITGPAIAWSKTSRFAMKRTRRLEGCAANRPEDEVDVGDVVERQQRTAGGGDVLGPACWKRRPSTLNSALQVEMIGG